MQRENPRLWNDLPPAVRERVHERVLEELPGIVRTVTDGIGRESQIELYKAALG